MTTFPRDPSFDATLPFLNDPYGYISATSRRLGADAFETRLLLRPTICLTGEEAAELFYDPDRFRRAGAAPGRLKRTLFGQGGVQGTDGAEHRSRKGMLLAALAPERIAGLATRSRDAWLAAARRWALDDGATVLYDEAREVLCRSVCDWAGVPLPEDEVARRTRTLAALYEGAGAVGPRHWRARLARKRANRWAEDRIERLRARGEDPHTEASAAARIAFHRGPDGELLPARIAAAELLNVLRPTVAVSVFVTFAALALHLHPHARRVLETGGADEVERFVHEVRRLYPFFPAAAARVRRSFEWRGHRFPEGRRVLLDLHGIDHDPRIWEAPEAFRPERFAGAEPGPYALVPQGGGDHAVHHRCAGEWATVELMKVAVDLLVRRVRYRVPEQTLTIDRSKLPALPSSRFVIRDVRLVE